MLLDLVIARDAQVDAALPNEGGDIGGREEDEGDGQVLDKGNVEAVLTPELDVGAFEDVQGGLEKATLLKLGVSIRGFQEVSSNEGAIVGGTHSWVLRRAAGLLGFRGGLALEPW